jgi:hypothetical protein
VKTDPKYRLFLYDIELRFYTTEYVYFSPSTPLQMDGKGGGGRGEDGVHLIVPTAVMLAQR